VILGIVPMDSGTIEVLGQDLATLDRSGRHALLRKVGMAFQQGALFDFMTVRENILFAMENMTEFPRAEQEERVSKMLEAVYLPAAGRKLPSELSGGMRRRVGIVRAMVTDPRLVLLDEPTAGLDPVTSTVVIDMIHRLGEQTKSSLLCVSSSVEVAFTFAKEVAILRDGNIIGKGTWEELHALGDPWITNFLDVREFDPANVGADIGAETGAGGGEGDGPAIPG
jgi:phospholipid/cholesterol/gamma-HCH transport system ATP-binding protein